jgi:two-component system sensor histidine kinase KdpD
MRERLEREVQQPLDGSSAIIAAAAHELKTPLTLISHISQMLADEQLGLTDQDRAKYVQRLQLVSARTLRLVQHLTLSYRLEDDKQVAFAFDLEPVNTREVCEQVLHELTPYAHEYNQELQFKAAARPQLVVANRDIMYDVVVNLVDNAIRHNTPGKPVQVSALAHADHVRVNVHDSGVGVSKHDLNRLRESLGRELQPLSGHAGTSGLGLYIANQLATAMGGSLGLGRARQGTTFFANFLRSKQLSLW